MPKKKLTEEQPTGIPEKILWLRDWKNYYLKQIGFVIKLKKKYFLAKELGLVDQDPLAELAADLVIQYQNHIDSIDEVIEGLGIGSLVTVAQSTFAAGVIGAEVYSGNLKAAEIPKPAQDWIKKFTKGLKKELLTYEAFTTCTPISPFVWHEYYLRFSLTAEFLAKTGARQLDISGVAEARINGGVKFIIGVMLPKKVEVVLSVFGFSPDFFHVDVSFEGRLIAKAALGRCYLSYLPADKKNKADVDRLEGILDPFSLKVFLEGAMVVDLNADFVAKYKLLEDKYKESAKYYSALYTFPAFPELKAKYDWPIPKKFDLFSIEVPQYAISYTPAANGKKFDWGYVPGGECQIKVLTQRSKRIENFVASAFATVTTIFNTISPYLSPVVSPVVGAVGSVAGAVGSAVGSAAVGTASAVMNTYDFLINGDAFRSLGANSEINFGPAPIQTEETPIFNNFSFGSFDASNLGEVDLTNVNYNPEQYTVNLNKLETPIFTNIEGFDFQNPNIEGFDFNSQTEYTTKTVDINVDEIQPADGDEDEDDEDEFVDADEYVPPTE